MLHRCHFTWSKNKWQIRTLQVELGMRTISSNRAVYICIWKATANVSAQIIYSILAEHNTLAASSNPYRYFHDITEMDACCKLLFQCLKICNDKWSQSTTYFKLTTCHSQGWTSTMSINTQSTYSVVLQIYCISLFPSVNMYCCCPATKHKIKETSEPHWTLNHVNKPSDKQLVEAFWTSRH